MREILFRGKRIDTNEWVFGYPLRGVCSTGSAWMMLVPPTDPNDLSKQVFIDEETLGSCAGLRDKNGKQIFEGDIVLGLHHHELAVKGVVTFQDGAFGLRWNRGKVREFSAFTSICNVDYKAIGNIHDNPELLEEVSK